MFIEDGTTGRVATVNKENRLLTTTITETMEQHHSDLHKCAFIVGNGNVTCDGGMREVLCFKNTSSSDKVYITYTFASTNTDGVFVAMEKDCVYTASGTLVSPVNMNFSSNLSAAAEVYIGDNIDAEDGISLVGGYINKGMNEFNFNGALILDRDDTISFMVQGPNGAKATVGLRFYYHGNVY